MYTEEKTTMTTGLLQNNADSLTDTDRGNDQSDL